MSNKKPSPIVGAGILAQLSIAIVTAMVAPLLVGIWISRTFELGPLAIVCAMGIGMLIGGFAVYRIVKKTYDELSSKQ
jgi:F0F1-type ATP synthase assembly protein I